MHRQIFASVFVWILVILISGCSWKIPTNQGKGETAPSDMINAAATDTSAVSAPGTFPDASTSALQSSERCDVTQPLQAWELTNACGVQTGMTQVEVEDLVGKLSPGDTGNRLYDEQNLAYRFWDRSGGEPKLMEMEWNAAVENDEIVFETAQDAPSFRGICLGDTIDTVLEKFPCADRELKKQQSQALYGQEGDADYASLHLIADSYYSLSFYVDGQWRASIDFSRVQQRVFRIVIYGNGYWQPGE